MKKILSDTKLKQELTILANKLNSKCEELGGGITFICVLNGGFMFFSDLVKLIKYPIKIIRFHFINIYIIKLVVFKKWNSSI